MTRTSAVEARGWNLEPVLRAEKDGQVFRGTAAEIRDEIAAFERVAVENEEAKQRVRKQEEREQIDRLLRRVRALAGEPFSARSTDQLVEAVKELLAQPQEILDAHEEYVAWRERVKRALAEFEAKQAA
jgi:hypothetical protein